MTLPQRIKKEIIIAVLSIPLGLLLTFGFVLYTKAYSETSQADIARNVIRFHVLANSDSDEDQELKLKVRDSVLEHFKAGLSAGNSVDETRDFLETNMEDIRILAESVVQDNGYTYPVKVSLSKDYFPTKVYGDVVFPPGDYEALRIVIGDGEGRNWWCVMFPPLCYVDVTQGTMSDEGKQQLQVILPEDEYQLLTHMENNTTIKIKFKVVEWWQNRKHDADVNESYAAIPQ